jgi:hypothetical protein
MTIVIFQRNFFELLLRFSYNSTKYIVMMKINMQIINFEKNYSFMEFNFLINI